MKTKFPFAMLLLVALSTITSCTTDEIETTNIENQTMAKEADLEEPGDPLIPKGRD